MARRSIEPPARLTEGMKGLADRRGFLATHVASRDETGAPVLKLVDTAKSDLCMAERRCQACGLDLDADGPIVLIGSHGDRDFKEPPLHVECAVYSVGWCPALVRRDRGERLLITVCWDYAFVPGEDGGPAVCLPLAAGGREPVEHTPESLYALLTELKPETYPVFSRSPEPSP